jgi:RNA polymerase sigma factor (sigma-70 family)
LAFAKSTISSFLIEKMSDTLSPTDKARLDSLFSHDYQKHLDALYNFAFHLTHSEADADDLVQDTFLRAYRNYESYEQGTNLKAWLFRILKNLFINEFHKKNRQGGEAVNFDDVQVFHENEELAGEAPKGFLDLREEMFDNLMGDEVTMALQSLHPDAQAVIMLDLEDFSYEEMGEILGVPTGTVRSRLFRARNLLKEKLMSYAEAQGFKNKR